MAIKLEHDKRERKREREQMFANDVFVSTRLFPRDRNRGDLEKSKPRVNYVCPR